MLSDLTEICPHQEDKSTCRAQKTTTCLLDSESYFTLEEERTDPLPSQVPVYCDSESSYVDPGRSPNWLRIRTLLQQLPPQDSDERYCSTLGEEERVQLRLFSAHRRQQALGQGVIRLVPPRFEGHMCEKLIFSGRCTEAAGRRWHEDHFCCLDCTRPLSSGQYTLPGSGPCCPRCFESRLDSDAEPSQPEGETLVSQSNDVSLSSCHENSMEQPRDSPEQDRIPQSFLNSAGIFEKAPTGRSLSHSLKTSHPAEDGPCLTCSSSSDSEPDGFFLGQPLPQSRVGGPTAPGSLHLHQGDRASGRQCRVC
ncbi:prickle-like protein 4 isoform X3 [Monodelphis domestica]|uniref:prickle-like protein 4 isoform X3 n=1 Tax=Monodelphis domestica TaxID=13616 RepID=UPI0004434DFA|nr:prickle-like protein 4 isoform X3 [Monodelphis domestica]